MPTIFDLFGMRYFFYAGDHEPIHVHLENGDGRAMVILDPVISVEYNQGIKTKDLNKAIVMIETYKEEIIKVWSEHH